MTLAAEPKPCQNHPQGPEAVLDAPDAPDALPSASTASDAAPPAAVAVPMPERRRAIPVDEEVAAPAPFGWFNFHSLYDAAIDRFIADGIAQPTVVEVGVWEGKSLLYMADRLLRRFGDENFRICGVDKWDEESIDLGPANTQTATRIAELRRAGLTVFQSYMANKASHGPAGMAIESIVSDSAAAASKFGDDWVDFVFIDADHRADAVEADIKAWLPKARILAGHDSNEGGVREALRRVSKETGTQFYIIPSINCWVTDKALAEAVKATPSGIFIGMPVGGSGSICAMTAGAMLNIGSDNRLVSAEFAASSFLVHGFNGLLAKAINLRAEYGLKYFVMLHSDIGPQDYNWVEQIIATLDHWDFDVVSAISPIKDGFGLTSTAIDTDPWAPKRLTMHELMAEPEVFDNNYAKRHWGAPLLINTGLMVIRLDSPFAEKIVFRVQSDIRRTPDGKLQSVAEPEDWNFSRWLNARGLRYGVTRGVKLHHVGTAPFNNFTAWGVWKRDIRNDPPTNEELASGATSATPRDEADGTPDVSLPPPPPAGD